MNMVTSGTMLTCFSAKIHVRDNHMVFNTK